MGKLGRNLFVVLTLALTISFGSASAYFTTTPKSLQSPTPETTELICEDFDSTCLAKGDLQKFENAVNAARTGIENLKNDANLYSEESLLAKFEHAKENFENFRTSLNESPQVGCLKTYTCWDAVTKIFQEAIDELKGDEENEGEAKMTAFARPPWKKWRHKVGKAIRVVAPVIPVLIKVG